MINGLLEIFVGFPVGTYEERSLVRHVSRVYKSQIHPFPEITPYPYRRGFLYYGGPDVNGHPLVIGIAAVPS